MLNKKKNNKQYISRGSYGCVVKPPYKCKGTVEFKNPHASLQESVSKIFDARSVARSKSNMSMELVKTAKIMKIDPQSKFTVKINYACQTNVDEATIDTCNRHRSKRLATPIYKNVSEIISENGGKEYDKISPMRVELFMDKFVPIIQGLKTMTRHEYCHRDIKPGNMLYDSAKNKHVIIDFGLMKAFARLYEHDQYPVFSYLYAYYPPEFSLLAYFFDKSNTVNDMLHELKHDPIKQYLKRNMVKSHISSIFAHYHTLKYKQIDSFIVSVKTFLTKNRHVFVKQSKLAILKELGKFCDPAKIDIYSLGVTLMQMYHWGKITGSGVSKLFLEMTCMNPIDRPNHDVVISMVKALRR